MHGRVFVMDGFSKKLSVSLMVTLLGFFLIGCGQPYNSTTHMQIAENTVEVEVVVYEIDLPTTDHIGEHDSGYTGSVEVVQTVESGKILVDENFYVTYIPYPLIFAVLDYFEGALEVPNSRILPWSSRSYAAYITDIDGDGSLGILAWRYEDFSGDERFIRPHHHSFKIFYLYNGDVIYKDFSDPDAFYFFDGSPFSLFISTDKRLLMRSFGVDGFRTYTFFTIESGKIIFDFTIIRDPLSWENGYVTYSAFYKLEGGPIWDERGDWFTQFREKISEEEFNEKAPVVDSGYLQQDITEQIFQLVY